MLTLISDKSFIRLYAMAWIIAYLTVYFFLKSYLPEEYLRDSLLIQKLALSGDASDWGGAYAIAAYIARTVPVPVIDGVVATMGSLMIWQIVMSLKTVRGMVLIVPILIPFIILNVMDFCKETFVVPLAFGIMWWTIRTRSTLHAFISICVFYFLYGIFFREYYLIILAVFVGCIIIYKASPPMRLLYILLAFLSLFLIPPKVFINLQGHRDVFNHIANALFSVVHTAIINPLPPNSATHFIINYLYVFVRLTFPFLFRQSVNELVLFINILFYGYLIRAGLKNRKMDALTLLPLLFIAHILVLIIFEPDAGSYMRHASSVLFYLLPSLRLTEQRRAEATQEKELHKDQYKAA